MQQHLSTSAILHRRSNVQLQQTSRKDEKCRRGSEVHGSTSLVRRKRSGCPGERDGLRINQEFCPHQKPHVIAGYLTIFQKDDKFRQRFPVLR